MLSNNYAYNFLSNEQNEFYHVWNSREIMRLKQAVLNKLLEKCSHTLSPSLTQEEHKDFLW